MVLLCDGGRLRQRVAKKDRRKDNGYRDFDAPWVEPRQLVIYTLDKESQLEREWSKVADASIAEATDFIDLFEFYMVKYEVAWAEEIMVLADGQTWQGEHIAQRLEKLGVDAEKVTQIMDKSHAVQRFYDIAREVKWKTQGLKARFVLRGRELLENVDIEALCAHCMTLAKGRRARTIKSLVGYFKTHAERMKYDDYKKAK